MSWLAKIFSGMGTKILGILSIIIGLEYIRKLRKDNAKLEEGKEMLEHSLKYAEKVRKVTEKIDKERMEREELNEKKDIKLKKQLDEVMNENTNVVDFTKLRKLLDPDLKDK